jgi:prepilin-type N-terminal cleavage/methylation domain-containing protein
MRSRFQSGFTLIELLTVMAIIAVLAALLFPAIRSALQKTTHARALQDCQQLASVFRAYHGQYGKWPAVTNGTVAVDNNLRRLLAGDHLVTTAPYQGNPHQTTFMEFNPKDLDGSGAVIDPWGNAYQCRFDHDGDDEVENPFQPGVFLRATVLVWSRGADGLADTAGDHSVNNRDNPRSW